MGHASPHAIDARCITGYIVLYQPPKIKIHAKKQTHPFFFSYIHPKSMPRDEVDISVITSERRKRTLSSYVRNQDNNSGDRDQYVKRIKQTVNPGVFPNKIYYIP